MKELSKIAFIPARGGSKRIPKKNIINFKDKPIISYTIESAIKANIFDEVIVSTDNEEIAKISEKYGAKAILRKIDLATDTSMVKDVCYDFLSNYLKQNKKCDILCTLFATAPLRNYEDIKNVVSLIIPDICDFSLAVTTYDLPPHQALLKKENDFIEPMWPDLINHNERDIGRLVVDNGSTYAFDVKKFMELKTFFGPKLKVHEMPKNRSVDLDTEDDLQLLKYYSETN